MTPDQRLSMAIMVLEHPEAYDMRDRIYAQAVMDEFLGTSRPEPPVVQQRWIKASLVALMGMLGALALGAGLGWIVIVAYEWVRRWLP